MLAVLLSVVTFADSATADTTNLTPPPPTQAIATPTLPNCTSVIGTSAATLNRDSVQLGYGPSSHPKMLVNLGSDSYEVVPIIPCAGTTASAPIYANILTIRMTGTSTQQLVRAKATITFTCITLSTNVQSTFVLGGDIVGGPNVNGVLQTPATVVAPTTTPPNTTNCPSLISVKVHVEATATFNGTTAMMDTLWMPSYWNSAAGGWVPSTNVNQFYAPGTELPMSCPINSSGADMGEIFSNVIQSYAALPGCLFVPVGWDRAGKITTEFNGGAVGQLVAAFKSSVPSGLACGPVAAIPWGGTTISLDTCPIDVASTTVKTVIGWVFVLGIGALMVRRILWVVGSKA